MGGRVDRFMGALQGGAYEKVFEGTIGETDRFQGHRFITAGTAEGVFPETLLEQIGKPFSG